MLDPFLRHGMGNMAPSFLFCIEHWVSCFLHQTIEFSFDINTVKVITPNNSHNFMRSFIIQFIPVILQLSGRYFYSGGYFY